MGGMPRVPRDRTLTEWIRELESQGKVEKFYHTKEWRTLRAEVLRDHPLCADCMAKSPYERNFEPVARAERVHHINELHDRPDMGLTRYYTTPDGQTHENLVALCWKCHEIRHGRLQDWGAKREAAPVTVERFD